MSAQWLRGAVVVESLTVCDLPSAPCFFVLFFLFVLQWKYTQAWTACSVSCGAGGMKTSAVQCTEVTSGKAADASLCLDAPPPTTADCEIVPCPAYEVRTSSARVCALLSRVGAGARVRESMLIHFFLLPLLCRW